MLLKPVRQNEKEREIYTEKDMDNRKARKKGLTEDKVQEGESG